MKINPNCFYSKNDEWVLIEGNTARIGVSDYAQEALSDIVFVDISVSVGDFVEVEDNLGTVESVKAASDLYSPVAGKVIAVNESVSDTPELVNQDPFGSAWLVQLETDGKFDTSHLLDAAAYEAYCNVRG